MQPVPLPHPPCQLHGDNLADDSSFLAFLDPQARRPPRHEADCARNGSADAAAVPCLRRQRYDDQAQGQVHGLQREEDKEREEGRDPPPCITDFGHVTLHSALHCSLQAPTTPTSETTLPASKVPNPLDLD
jgi:hypothetical protein